MKLRVHRRFRARERAMSIARHPEANGRPRASMQTPAVGSGHVHKGQGRCRPYVATLTPPLTPPPHFTPAPSLLLPPAPHPHARFLPHWRCIT